MVNKKEVIIMLDRIIAFAPVIIIVALVVGIVCAIVVFIVLVGGIQRIGDVCALLVPVMAIIYVIASLIVIFVNITAVPARPRAVNRRREVRRSRRLWLYFPKARLSATSLLSATGRPAVERLRRTA